jgi:hypothetical protein
MVVVKEGATAADQILWITFEWEDAPGAVGVNTYKLFGKCDGGQKVTIVGTQAPVVMIAEEIKA